MDDSGYDLNDPKHPDWHSIHADVWDNREKEAQVEGELYFNGVQVTPEEFERLADEAAEEMNREEDRLTKRFGVSHQTASAMVYLRSRSWWSVEKELELIERDRAGDPIPLSDVLSGEF